MVPKYANGMQMDTQIAQARSENFEGERRYALHGHGGAVRLMAYGTKESKALHTCRRLAPTDITGSSGKG